MSLSPVPSMTDQVSVTILSGASITSSIKLGNRIPVGIIIPAAWTAADLTFQTSWDDTTFYDVYGVEGTEIGLDTVAGGLCSIDYANLFGIGPYLKIRSGPTALAVNQGADRVLILIAARPITA
jgi:hypothetical protein